MRYWLDTEFIEDGKTIDLISIGIVAEDGREFYALNWDCDFSKANDWVKKNVLPQLSFKPIFPPEIDRWKFDWEENFSDCSRGEWHRAYYIVSAVAKFTGCCPTFPKGEGESAFCVPPDSSPPEFWGYYADYDWVVFCQLFGTMMDLPKGFPMYCRDIKQFCDDLGNPKLPEQGKGEHNALEDARWNKRAWEFLRDYQKS